MMRSVAMHSCSQRDLGGESLLQLYCCLLLFTLTAILALKMYSPLQADGAEEGLDLFTGPKHTT